MPLLQTKFHISTLRPTLVSRPRLFTKLQTSLRGKLKAFNLPLGQSTIHHDWRRGSTPHTP